MNSTTVFAFTLMLFGLTIIIQGDHEKDIKKLQEQVKVLIQIEQTRGVR